MISTNVNPALWDVTSFTTNLSLLHGVNQQQSGYNNYNLFTYCLLQPQVFGSIWRSKATSLKIRIRRAQPKEGPKKAEK
jgi:hypothetical protein